jgi:hypothetical protein
MDVPGDDFFAGSALPLDQNRGISGGHMLSQLEHLEETFRLSDGARDRWLVTPADLLLQLGVFHLDGPVLAGPPENRHQLVVGERLLDVVEGA